MSAVCHDRKRLPRSPARITLERRLARAGDALQRARCRLHHNHEAVLATQEALMACQLAWEEAALRVAALADVVERLQRDLNDLGDLDSLGSHLDAGIADMVG